MDIMKIVNVVVCMPLCIGLFFLLYKMKSTYDRMKECDENIKMLDILIDTAKNGKCEVCGKKTGWKEDSRVVRITQPPYLKILCGECAKDHEFLPLTVENESPKGRTYGIDYIVFPPKDDETMEAYVERIKQIMK